MSAAGRGPRRGGPDDFYRTPAWVVDRLLDICVPRAGMFCEPAAGDGAIIKAVSARRIPATSWVAVECRATCMPALAQTGVVAHANAHASDFLTWEPTPLEAAAVTTVITNPPFHSCEAFIRRASELFPEADLVFLVRLGFLASQARVPLWRDLGMPDVFVLPDRPSFTDDGATDSADYAWIIFPGKERRDAGAFRVLGLTPKAERRPCKGATS